MSMSPVTETPGTLKAERKGEERVQGDMALARVTAALTAELRVPLREGRRLHVHPVQTPADTLPVPAAPPASPSLPDAGPHVLPLFLSSPMAVLVPCGFSDLGCFCSMMIT